MENLAMIKVEKYYPSDNADFRGIPFIEAWPPLSRAIIGNLMESRIRFSENERTHSADLRLQYAYRLMDFFIPLDNQIDFAQKLWNLICFGYKARATANLDPTDSFKNLCAAIEAQQVKPGKTPHFRDSIWSAFLVGTPGTGKTSTPLALLNRLADTLLQHTQYPGTYKCLFIHVRVPAKAKGKSLAEAVFEELRGMATQVGLPLPYGLEKKPSTLPEFESAIRVLAQKLNVGLIILDELQHLYARTGGMDQDSMKFLTEFLSMLELPVLFIGTWDSIPLTGLEMRLARRVTAPCTGYFSKMGNDIEFETFLRLILRYQFTHKTTIITQELINAFYFHTQGIQDLVVKLLVLCQLEAIITEEEEITPALVLSSGEEHMRVLAPAVRMLREGRHEHDPDIWDLEPTDFADYVRRFSAAISARRRYAKGRLLPTDLAMRTSHEQTTAAVADALQVLGVSDEADARAIATAALEVQPGSSAAEIVVSTIQDAVKVPAGPRPTTSRDKRKQEAVGEAFQLLDDLDLRKIAYSTAKNHGNHAQAFAKMGLLKILHEDIPC